MYFIGLGSALSVDGARLKRALGDGIERATARYSLRSSIAHPLTRHNPQTNTGLGVPIFHLNFVEKADWLDLLLVPKGSGSENMSFLAMLTPSYNRKLWIRDLAARTRTVELLVNDPTVSVRAAIRGGDG